MRHRGDRQPTPTHSRDNAVNETVPGAKDKQKKGKPLSKSSPCRGLALALILIVLACASLGILHTAIFKPIDPGAARHSSFAMTLLHRLLNDGDFHVHI